MLVRNMNENRINGYVYIATGEKYIQEAEVSAKSLKGISPSSHVTLITDQEHSSLNFDNIEFLALAEGNGLSWKQGLISKIVGCAESPYLKTIFVDTDTYFTHDVSALFGILDYYDVLVGHDYYDKSEITVDSRMLNGYFPYNTGVIAFRKSEEVNNFLNDWKRVYLENFKEFWSDQPAFMRALINNKVRVYAFDATYNFRFLNNVGFPDGEKVKVIHGRCSEKEFREIEKIVNKDCSQRVWVANRKKCYSWNERNFVILLGMKMRFKLSNWLRLIGLRS